MCSLGVLPCQSFKTKEILWHCRVSGGSKFFRVTTVEPSPQTLNDKRAQQGGTWHGGLLKMLSIVSSAKSRSVIPRGASDKSEKVAKR